MDKVQVISAQDKVEKIAKIVLWSLIGISIVVMALFLLVGYDTPYEEDPKQVNPQMTDLLLIWTYILIFATIIITIGAVIYGYVNGSNKSKHEDVGMASKAGLIGWGTLIVGVVAGLIVGFANKDEVIRANNMGKKRKMPGLNTSSTADISFMLLIFFLVTTSMDTDQGLARTLPKPPEDDQLNNEIKVKERNILNIRINKDNYLLIGDDYATLADVKERAKEFIKNEDNRPNLPELKPKKIKGLGNKTMMVTENHVISVQTDRGTDYGVYFAVQDALVSAYNELRDELAKEEFGYKYEFLTADQQKAIREVYPQKISEAEPKAEKCLR